MPTPLSETEIASATTSLTRLLDTLDTVLFGQRELIELVVIGVLVLACNEKR